MPRGAEGATRAALEPVTELLDQLAGPPATEVGGFFSDMSRNWRLRRVAKTLQKTKRILADAGIDPEQVPMSVLWPLLDGASLEDDESLADRWAALIASAAMPGAEDAIRYAGILRELSPTEARLLDGIFEASFIDGTPSWFDKEIDSTEVGAGLKIEGELLERSMDNLFRLRLVTNPWWRCGSEAKTTS